MNRRLIILLLIIAIVSLSGCGDRIDVEEITLALMIGLDLDENNDFIVYMSSPVFSKDAMKKSEEFGVKSTTLRQAREKFDAMATAMTMGGKVQVVLLGKRLLQHQGWFPLLDVIYRDAKLTVNSRVLAVDGPVSEIFDFHPEDKPRLSLHITKLIDTASRRGITVKSDLRDLHYQFYEKGITPFLTEIKKNKNVEITGTSLLDKKGKYISSLSLQENTLFQLLQNQDTKQLTLTVSIPKQNEEDIFQKNKTSFYVIEPSRKVKVDYRQGKFHFDIQFKLPVLFTERLFWFDMKKDKEKLEKMIEEQLHQQFTALIKKIQQQQIDPIGLGLYARAYHYKEWKKVQNRWGKTLAKADIKVSVKIETRDRGDIK